MKQKEYNPEIEASIAILNKTIKYAELLSFAIQVILSLLEP